VKILAGAESMDMPAVFHGPRPAKRERGTMFPLPASGHVRIMQPFATSPDTAPLRRREPIAGSLVGAMTGALVACIAGLAAGHLSAAACLGSALICAVAGVLLAIVPAGAEAVPPATPYGPSQRALLLLGAETEDHD
jgi:hypothetical protein